MRDYVWKRLGEVLSAPGEVEPLTQLSKTDRQAIVEVLRDTKEGLPDDWAAASGP